jgi:CRP-like cAMP-binding protein
MVGYTSPADLQTALQQCPKKIWKTKSSVLFRRGEKASGMFIVLSGRVILDFGVDASPAINRSYGAGALVGLPAALTRRNYSMTATVAQDSQLGFWPTEALDSLLRKHPDLCRQLLGVLSEKISENQQIAKALLSKEARQSQHSGVV